MRLRRMDGSMARPFFIYLVAFEGLYGENLQIKKHIFLILFGELRKTV